MTRHLYFVCPTDNLEPVIDNEFKQENYYITSLGNSITFDNETISEINELLSSRNIRNVSFVLSHNNRVVMEAIEKGDTEIPGLIDFQCRIKEQKKQSEALWLKADHRLLTLSYHLNSQISLLRSELSCIADHPPSIKGMIYDLSERKFKGIYSYMISENQVSVN